MIRREGSGWKGTLSALLLTELNALCSHAPQGESQWDGTKGVEKRRLWIDTTRFTLRQYLHFTGGSGLQYSRKVSSEITV